MPFSTPQHCSLSKAVRQPVPEFSQAQERCILRQASLRSSASKPEWSRRYIWNNSSSGHRQQKLSKPHEFSVRASADTETEEDIQIEGIDRAYCDEFVCTSSPQASNFLHYAFAHSRLICTFKRQPLPNVLLYIFQDKFC